MPPIKRKADKPIKQKNIRSRLMRGIVFIILLTVLIPILAYNNLPEWVYYLTPGTRLWLAASEVDDAWGTDAFLETLKDVEKTYDSTVELYTADGRFVYSSRALIDSLPDDLTQAKTVDEKYLLNYKTTYGLMQVGGKGFLIKEYNETNADVTFLDCYQYLQDGSRVEICIQVSQLSATAKVDFLVSFVVIMLLLIVGLAVIWVYITRMTRPIAEMRDITDKMARLDFSEKCPETKLEEITDLARSINTLSDNLDVALTDLKQKNEKLIEDIENEKTIDNLRQTFISGISHELKTPIAIIQGYAEGAKMFYASGNTEAADKYCDIIADEAGRMNTMIMKLLEITKYSSGAYEPVREDFEIRALVEEWFERNASILEEKGIRAGNLIPSGLWGNGDKLILSSVVNNYLSNAVSHADGAKIIKTTCRTTENAYRVCVFNTGRHIEAKDIDKIWTSFYRADKSLSRSQGRFGLGLAIVTSIQDLHGEAYGVENVEGGVEFWFDIKKAEVNQKNRGKEKDE